MNTGPFTFLALFPLLLITSATPGSSQALSPSTALSPFEQSMAGSMLRMHTNMMAVQKTGEPDDEFAAMMILHHQGAVDMAKGFLLYGKDDVLRRLAQEILVTQTQEIELMRARSLASRTAPRISPPYSNPDPRCSISVSSRDRVYVAEQTSGTVSVIDPAANKLLGVIRLGDSVPGALSPLYRGQLLVHGLGFSPDHRTLAVVSIGSNSITIIDTESNKILGVVYIGRSPHEAFFTPDGAELWATVRGEDYVSIIDPVALQEVRRVKTANGPGMVLFRPDGRYAFVPSSFTPELDVIDRRSYEIIARVPQASPFSPNLAVSSDGTEVWFTLKDSGQVQVMEAAPPFAIRATLRAGPICNHVALVDNARGQFAYVTVGGENAVKVFKRGGAPQLYASISTGDLPHGIWGSDDGTRVYVGLENQDQVIAIDTLANRVIATIPVGQQPQALVYVSDAVPRGDGLANLAPLGISGESAHLTLTPAGLNLGGARATVSLNSLGALDLLQAAVSGLVPGEHYALWLSESRDALVGNKEELATFETNLAGAQIVQAIGPLRNMLLSQAQPTTGQRFLLITRRESQTTVLVQRLP